MAIRERKIKWKAQHVPAIHHRDGMLYLVKKIPRLFVRNLQTLKEDEGSG